MEQKAHSDLYDLVQCVVISFLTVVVLLTFLGRHMMVDGASMESTFLNEDRVIVRSAMYTPDYGDVIIAAKQDFRDGTPFVKRVIALAGDVVDIDGQAGVVYINGLPLDEPYTKEPTYRTGDIAYPYTVPENCIFVMGDNRNDSTDSRFQAIGPVDTREVLGQVVVLFYPFSHFSYNF